MWVGLCRAVVPCEAVHQRSTPCFHAGFSLGGRGGGMLGQRKRAGGEAARLLPSRPAPYHAGRRLRQNDGGGRRGILRTHRQLPHCIPQTDWKGQSVKQTCATTLTPHMIQQQTPMRHAGSIICHSMTAAVRTTVLCVTPAIHPELQHRFWVHAALPPRRQQ